MSNQKKELYKQCRLSRKNERQMSFIPEEIAFEGNIVKLKEADEWSEHWKVDEVYEPPMAWDMIQEAANQARHTRKFSDI